MQIGQVGFDIIPEDEAVGFYGNDGMTSLVAVGVHEQF